MFEAGFKGTLEDIWMGIGNAVDRLSATSGSGARLDNTSMSEKTVDELEHYLRSYMPVLRINIDGEFCDTIIDDIDSAIVGHTILASIINRYAELGAIDEMKRIMKSVLEIEYPDNHEIVLKRIHEIDQLLAKHGICNAEAPDIEKMIEEEMGLTTKKIELIKKLVSGELNLEDLDKIADEDATLSINFKKLARIVNGDFQSPTPENNPKTERGENSEKPEDKKRYSFKEAWMTTPLGGKLFEHVDENDAAVA